MVLYEDKQRACCYFVLFNIYIEGLASLHQLDRMLQLKYMLFLDATNHFGCLLTDLGELNKVSKFYQLRKPIEGVVYIEILQRKVGSQSYVVL